MAIIACLLPVLTLLSVSVSAENCFVPLRGGRSVPVKDVLCVVSSWENMTCTWDLQKLYNESSNNSLITDLRTRHRNFSSDEFNITLEWTVFSSFSLCRHLRITDFCLTCRFLQHDGRDSYMPGGYYFQVNMTNTIQNSSVSSKFSIATDSYVQPSKVTHVSASPNRTDVKLTWNRDKPWYNAEFRVRYISTRQKRNKFRNWKEERILPKDFDLWTLVDYDALSDGATISNLAPNTEYVFQISYIPIVNRRAQGYWSEYTEITVRTKQDVPGDVPYIRHSFYHCLDPVCSRIILYWQPITEEKQHGPLTHYRLIVNGVTKTVEANVSSTELSVDGSVSTTILLTQASLKGYPHVPDSRVIIPPISKRLREPSDLVVEAYNASCVRIKWRSDEQDVRNSSFVVVRCKKDIHGKCSEFIKFKILPSSVNESYMNFFGIDVMEQKFGIAMETHVKGESHVTSGIAWSECTYQHNAVSMIPLRLGIVMKDVGSDSMTLTWRPYRCEESKGYLLQYRLDYCRMGDNCSDSYTSLNISSGSTNYTLTNLLPGKYQSWIRGTFPGGVGPYSEAVQFVIHGKISQDEAEWIVVVLVSVMTVFLVTVLYCICHTRRGIKKEIPIEIPHVKSSSEGLLQRQRKVSVDSGNSSVDSSYGSDKFLLKQSASGPEYYSKEENDSLLSQSIEQGDTSSDKSIYISDEDYVTDQSNEDYDVLSYVKNDVDSGSPQSFKCLSYIQSGYTPQENYFMELKDKEMNQMNIPKADNCDLHYEKEANKVKSDYVEKAVVDMETNKIRGDYSCSTEEIDEYTKVQLNQYLEYPGNVDNTGALVQKLPSNIQTGCYIYTEGYVM